MKNLRIGIAGLAHSHPTTFAGIIRDEWKLPIAAVWDDDQARAAEFAGTFGGVAVSSPEQLLDEKLDGVIVTSRNNRHCGHAALFVERGLPVFVDKPLATGLDAAKSLVELASKNGAMLFSSSALRYAPAFDQLIRTVRSGELGRPLNAMVSVFYGLPVLYGKDPDYWELSEDEAGGIIFNYGIHCVEPLIAALGTDVRSVSCHSASVDLPDRVNDVTVLTLQFGSGAVGIGRLIGSAAYNNYLMELHGTKKSLTASDVTTWSECANWGAEPRPLQKCTADNHGYAPMLRAFREAILTGRNPIPLDETLAVLSVLQAARSQGVLAEARERVS